MLGLLGACLKRQKRFKKPPLFPKMFKTWQVLTNIQCEVVRYPLPWQQNHVFKTTIWWASETVAPLRRPSGILSQLKPLSKQSTQYDEGPQVVSPSNNGANTCFQLRYVVSTEGSHFPSFECGPRMPMACKYWHDKKNSLNSQTPSEKGTLWHIANPSSKGLSLFVYARPGEPHHVIASDAWATGQKTTNSERILMVCNTFHPIHLILTSRNGFWDLSVRFVVHSRL